MPEQGRLGIFRVIILDLRELDGSNQIMFVHHLAECKKREEWFFNFVDRRDSFRENWIFVKKSRKF